MRKRYYLLKFFIYVFVIDLKYNSFKVYNRKDFFFKYNNNYSYIFLHEKD